MSGHALPRPTGPHAVGRLACDWIDPSRKDPYGRHHGDRVVPAVIWYPAQVRPGAPTAPYLPRSWWLHGPVWGASAGRVGTHSYERAPVAVSRQRFPVLLFSPAGWAPYFYAAMLEELASQGYVVVAIAHTHEMIPYTAFADGRRRWFSKDAVAGALSVSKRPHTDDVRERGAVVDHKAADLRFARAQLAHRGGDLVNGHLDLDRVGAFGHSFGGAAAVVACRDDPAVAACANLDGGMWRAPEQSTVDRPCLVVFAEHPEMTQPCSTSVEQGMFSSVEWCEQDRALHLACWQALVDDARPGVSLRIRGAEHRTFMDWKLLPLLPWSIGRMGSASIDGRTMWEATTRSLRALFDPHVRGAQAPSFEALASELPAVELGTPSVLFAPTP